jgi:glutamate--cysteine ligase
MRKSEASTQTLVTRSGIDRTFERRLSALLGSGEPRLLQGGLKGIERESLRVTPNGRVAHTPHPHALGSALANAHITTDFSEALIELVTPPFDRTEDLHQYLFDLHRFVYDRLGDELLWATSMPGEVAGDEDIPIACYGSSNVARMKTIYRRGLALRYGRTMQAIAGVHFNYSFPARFWEVYAGLRGQRAGQDFISAGYYELLRNYHRHGWIVLYLFGVSPVVDASFVTGRDVGLLPFTRDTLYGPHATSLRMSDIGYRNQGGLTVSQNSLQDYVRDLDRAISTAHPPYQRLGVKVDGEYRQLNANILQIENEFYGFIRPKRIAASGIRPSLALLRDGVEYVEVRALDVSAYDPVGVNQNKLRFLEAFLALCVLRDSPPVGQDEQALLDANHLTVARRGREPGLLLWRDGRQVPMADWAAELLDSMTGICEMLDQGDPERPYGVALAAQAAKLADAGLTPSARLLTELRSTGETFAGLALRVSAAHKAQLLAQHVPDAQCAARLLAEAGESLQKQAAIEAGDRMSFDEYLARYFAD